MSVTKLYERWTGVRSSQRPSKRLEKSKNPDRVEAANSPRADDGGGSAPILPAEAASPAAALQELEAEIDASESLLPLREARQVFERDYFKVLLTRERGLLARVAQKSGLERTHLYRKLKALGLKIGSGKKTDSR